ncbi:type II secretion system secretin GspD [Parahaliea sp. F7430]|uniref:Type II secretion system secretin GspD n=1 Tax=Sediminihaliea albiluteola TaxID=2758564 RepID=A0A7W2YL03_9GAMM|nr:type II secretion system secretin GspD [Sediminihaliea albiluteola]MBA6414274.1 type II secretion system secretin GspD [Sediminihaliea albiluteola]
MLLRWPVTVITLSLLLSSCASMSPAQKEPVVQSAATEQRAQELSQQSKQLSKSAAELADSAEKLDRVQPVIYRGTDRQIRMPAAEEPVRLVGKDVSLNFEDAPLAEVVHAVLGDILALDYIVDRPIKGKVTLRTRTPIPRDQLMEVVESLLKANNVLMVRGSDGRYLITGADRARNLRPDLSAAGEGGVGYSTIVVPLQYISASNMAEILRPVVEESSLLRVDNTRNLLILAGTQAQLDGWLEMVKTFDMDVLEGMSVGLFPLEHSGVESTAKVLMSMLDQSGKNGQAGDFGQLVRIIPIKRLNSLMVVTPRAHYLKTVSTWIERLDAEPAANFERRLYVYPVQNTTAKRLADLLTKIYSGSGSKSGSSSQTSTGFGGQDAVAPGLSSESIGSSSSSSSGSSSNMTTSFSNKGSSGGGISSASVGLGDDDDVISDVRIVADDENNSLMIYATGKEYKIIETALQQLDAVATQVVIEASILEVTLTDELKYGLEWSFKEGLGGDYTGAGMLDTGGQGIGALAPGFSYAVTSAADNFSAVLNALSSDSLINVISTPSVMVLDNHEAYIHVGDQVPVKSATTISEGGTTLQSVNYRDTGVKLTVRPSVNAGRLVTMDVAQSVTDVGTVDPATEQRSFLERNIMTRVAVRSDESVVLGGLIRENASAGDSGVPFLHKIPVLGALFGAKSSSNNRTELIVIITPRVISNESELRDISKEMRSRMRNMDLINYVSD